jgi:hypothetical protein
MTFTPKVTGAPFLSLIWFMTRPKVQAAAQSPPRDRAIDPGQPRRLAARLLDDQRRRVAWRLSRIASTHS